MRIEHFVTYWVLSVLVIVLAVVGWSIREIPTVDLPVEQSSEEVYSTDLTEEELTAIKDSVFGFSKLTETETFRTFELYIKQSYNSNSTEKYLTELSSVFSEHTDKEIRIFLVGTGNRELVYWVYEKGELERIK